MIIYDLTPAEWASGECHHAIPRRKLRYPKKVIPTFFEGSAMFSQLQKLKTVSYMLCQLQNLKTLQS
jgi:hypothetical protein